MAPKYDSSSIKIVENIEAVRKRPGMYIGDTGVTGLHHLIWEIFDNAIDECLAGYANKVSVMIKKNGMVVIEDNGRGIPVGIHAKTKKTTVETIFTVLHAGGKFGGEDSAYKVSGGLHGVGATVVNALSEFLKIEIWKDKKYYEIEFENAIVSKKLKVLGSTNKVGTRISFIPDKKVFKAKLSPKKIMDRLKESSFLNKNVAIEVYIEETDTKKVFTSKNGLKDFVLYLNESKKTITIPGYFEGKQQGIEVEIAIQYNDSTDEKVISYANNVKTIEGGSHETGFRTSLTKQINEYARSTNKLKAKDKNLDGGDLREGLTAVILVRIPEADLQFEGQTKGKLGTIKVKGIVETILSERLSLWLIENKEQSDIIVSKALETRMVREAARKARADARAVKDTKKGAKLLSGKLVQAQSRKAEERELFIVEGDSAGGSAKLGRDRKTQAILPLRGKVVNTQKANIKAILANEELSTVIYTIGASFGEDFKLKDSNYGKIIIMTDADTDGAHIQTLLLTFLYRYMKPLIDDGRVYIAMPPLYKIYNKKDHVYCWDDAGVEEAKKKLGTNVEIQRYKGLGEMNYDQLWETTMDPETRQLIKINIDSEILTEKRIVTLMGNDPKERREWIEDNVEFV